MKIGVLLHSASNKAGGIFGATLGQYKALYQYCDVKPKIFGLHDELIESDRLQWEPLPLTISRTTGPRSFGYAPELVSAMRRADLDLLHVHGLWTYPALASSIWAQRESKPYLTSIHGMLDSWAINNSRWKKRLAGLWYQNKHLRNAYCLQALTGSEADSIRAFGLRNPICLIPLGIDIPEITSSTLEQICSQNILLYLGRLHPKKGLNNLIHAWQVVHSKKQFGAETWILRIAGWGEGTYEMTLRSLCKELNIESSVQFIGAKFGAEKERAFSEANAFILPSFSEGLPMVVLEAWAHRLPVLMTPQCNIPAGFERGAAIEISSDVEGIAAGLKTLMSRSDAQRERMGEAGMQLVQSSFGWPSVVEKMYSVYRWILKKDRMPDCVYSS
ncbi:MAG: glycosyltransferase [Nitrospira sp.]|nr:glycosyltransferase [Nitrospira sp.]